MSASNNRVSWSSSINFEANVILFSSYDFFILQLISIKPNCIEQENEEEEKIK